MANTEKAPPAKAAQREGPVRLYTGFDWSNESYLLADCPDTNGRFFYYDKRVTTGVQWTLSPAVLVDLSGSYVFDRYFFEGQNQSDSNFNRIDVGNGAFLSGRVTVRY